MPSPPKPRRILPSLIFKTAFCITSDSKFAYFDFIIFNSINCCRYEYAAQNVHDPAECSTYKSIYCNGALTNFDKKINTFQNICGTIRKHLKKSHTDTQIKFYKVVARQTLLYGSET
jgi:hypothetical protein